MQGFGRVGGAGTGLGGSGTGQRGIDQSLGSHVPHGQNVGTAGGQVCLGSSNFVTDAALLLSGADCSCSVWLSGISVLSQQADMQITITAKELMGVQGYGRVAPSSGGQQGSGFQQGSAGNPPSYESGGQSQGGQGYGSRSGTTGSDSKYNASHAIADQGIADQAAYVGSKTVGHHNIPHYDKEDPKLPAATGGQRGGGNSQGDNLPSQDQVTAATEGHPTGQVQCLASCTCLW